VAFQPAGRDAPVLWVFGIGSEGAEHGGNGIAWQGGEGGPVQAGIEDARCDAQAEVDGLPTAWRLRTIAPRPILASSIPLRRADS